MQEHEDNIYINLAHQVGEVVVKKQAAYGDSISKTGKTMRILYPCGVTVEKLDDALLVVRVLDKLSRIANQKEAFDESPWQDIAGYGLLGVAQDAWADKSKARITELEENAKWHDP